MDGWLEFLTMVGALGAALLLLAWLGSGTKRRIGRSGRGDDEDPAGPIVDDMRDIGTLGGLGGGELEDVMVARFALRRAEIARRERGEE